MHISFLAKVVLFSALYCISDLSIKNNILRKVINRAIKILNFPINGIFN